MTILPLAAISANYANIGGKFRNLGGILFNYDYVTVTSVKFSINTVIVWYASGTESRVADKNEDWRARTKYRFCI